MSASIYLREKILGILGARSLQYECQGDNDGDVDDFDDHALVMMTLVMMRCVLLVGSPGMPVERAQLSDERRNTM